jgi:hypothetical protein
MFCLQGDCALRSFAWFSAGIHVDRRKRLPSIQTEVLQTRDSYAAGFEVAFRTFRFLLVIS